MDFLKSLGRRGLGRCGLAVIALLVPPVLRAATQANFYVAPNGDDGNLGTLAQPFRTLDKARQAAQTVNGNMTGDIIVYLRAGVYPLTNTVTFTPADSGTNGHNVIYEAYPGEQPRLSGGQAITGWTSAGNGMYVASNVGGSFRQLYVNGQRAVRARTPNQGSFYHMLSWDTTNYAVVINASEIQNWSGLNAVEMVVESSWDISRLRVASFSVANGTASVIPAQTESTAEFGGLAPGPKYHFAGSPYFFENAMAFLDAPGEWFLNTGTQQLFYIPRPGEDMTNAVAVAPRLDTLISLQGTAGTPVHNVQFQGLTFEYTTWLTPSSQGYVGLQAGWRFINSWGWNPAPGGVYLTYANNIRFERDVFRHMGGQGLRLDLGDNNDTVEGCVITDISGNGVSVESLSLPSMFNPSASQVCQNDAVVDNWISQTCQDYWGCVGVFGGAPSGFSVQHNEVSDLPFSGINVAFSTYSPNNLVQYNNVHNVMEKLQDGGGIYTFAQQPGTVIANNSIHDIHWASGGPLTGAGSPLATGVYLDVGADDVTVTNNVCTNIDTRYQSYLNNIFLNTALASNVISANDTQSPSVIAAAGLESAYQNIVSNVFPTTIATMTVTSAGLNFSLSPLSSPILTLTIAIAPGVLPAGTTVTLNTDIAYLLPGINSNEASLAAWQSGLGFALSAGGLQPNGLVSAQITYDPTQIPGGVSPGSIALARYDDNAGQWTLLPTTVDTVGHTIAGQINHFSLYAPLITSAGSDLSSLQIFPQPWEIGSPSGPYGAPALTFSNLPASATLKIFTLAGELVWQGTASPAGILTWDGHNRYGREAASGTYYAAFQSGGQNRVRRVVIIR